MAMPLNTFATVPVPGAYLPPDDRERVSLLVDYELGGVAIGDPSQGLQVQVWETRLNGNDIEVSPEGANDWTLVTTDTGITEISLAFDQNMRPTVAYVANEIAKLYWYDSFEASYVTDSLAGASSPIVLMDDKRAMQIGLNDILLFYILNNRVKHRVQRDRFAVEYDLADVPAGAIRFARAGMTDANRIQIEFA